MTTGPRSQCSCCVHFRSAFHPDNLAAGVDESTCAAFPAGIPDPVFYNGKDHRQPIEGDHGVQWQSNGQPYPAEFATAP